MSDTHLKSYERYLSAWSNVSSTERERLLRESVIEDVIFENPMQTRHGIPDVIAHLEGFQARFPDGSFRTNNMLGWGSNAMAEWQLVEGNGTPGFSGSDILKFNDNGLIVTILLFGNVEQQKLAWRRRDPVQLQPTT